MKQIAAVYDVDTVYGERLMRYLEKKEKIQFQIVYFTREEALLQFAADRSIRILIVNQQVLTEAVKALTVGHWIVLTEEKQEDGCSEYHYIYKYQSAEEIVREIMKYSESITPFAVAEKGEWHKNVQMIGIYSPAVDCLKTPFALAMAQLLSQGEAVLYLNLDAVSGLDYLLEKESETDLSDAVYYMHQGNLKEKLPELVQTYGAMDYISPVRCPEDLRIISADDFVRLLQEIIQGQVYRTIILDVAEGLYSPADILAFCHTIYMPMKSDCVSEARQREFWKYLERSDRSGIRNRTQQIRLPSYPGMVNRGRYIEQLLWGELGDYTRAVLKGGGMREWNGSTN